MVERFGWRMVKFTGLRGPAYVDLGAIAAVMAAKEPHIETPAPELDITFGATIFLTGGQAFYVRESADTVFADVHRFRTEQEPVPRPMKLSASAPAGDVAPVDDTPELEHGQSAIIPYDGGPVNLPLGRPDL